MKSLTISIKYLKADFSLTQVFSGNSENEIWEKVYNLFENELENIEITCTSLAA